MEVTNDFIYKLVDHLENNSNKYILYCIKNYNETVILYNCPYLYNKIIK